MNPSCLVVLLLAVSADVAKGPTSINVSRVRPLDAWASETLERGIDRSQLVRDLIETLQQTDVIVLLETTSSLPQEVGGTMRLLVVAGGYRYVRVSSARALLPATRAAMLGHELQHVRELAQSQAADDETLRKLYESIGYRVAGLEGYYETRAAAAAGRRVWAELHSRRRTDAAAK